MLVVIHQEHFQQLEPQPRQPLGLQPVTAGFVVNKALYNRELRRRGAL
jgi:hypothetical protein